MRKKMVKKSEVKKSNNLKEIFSIVLKSVIIVSVSVVIALCYTGLRAVTVDNNKNQNQPVSISPTVAETTQENVQPTSTPSPTATATKVYQIPSQYKYLFQPVSKKEDIHKVHNIEEAKVLYESGKALFIDARGTQEYKQSHIKGAIDISVGEAPSKIPQLKDVLKDKVLVTYCHGVGCHLSDKVAYALFDAGYRKIAIYFGGWPQWLQANLPIEEYQPPEEYKHLFVEADNENKIQEITLDDAKFLYDNMLANFIDVDYQDNYNKIHIDRAVAFPVDKVEQYLPGYDNFLKQKPVVIYCHGSGGKSRKVAKKLYEAGYKKILLFINGLKQWEKANYPIYKNPNVR